MPEYAITLATLTVRHVAGDEPDEAAARACREAVAEADVLAATAVDAEVVYV